MRKAAWIWFFCCGLVAAGNQAPGSGAYAGSLGAGAATGVERTGFGGNPAAFTPGGFGLRIDTHHPYGLEDLQVAEAGIFVDVARAGVSLDWRNTGLETLWREQGFRFAAAARLLESPRFPGRLDAGFAATAWRTEWPGRIPEWSTAAETGLIWIPWRGIRAGAFGAGPWPGRADGDHILHFGFEARNRGWEAFPASIGQALRLDFRKKGESPWRALASLAIRPHPACEFSAGLASPPFQASAGCALAWRGFRVRQALRYHRYLGRTWLSGADWVSGNVRDESPRIIQHGLEP